jgi:2-oxoglutarate ferredoxin oxidoreductase subunit delta
MSVVARGVYRINVYRELCKACGLCTAWCPQQVIVPDAAGFPLTPGIERCTDCKACERHCPDFAIEVIPPVPDCEATDVASLIHAR